VNHTKSFLEELPRTRRDEFEKQQNVFGASHSTAMVIIVNLLDFVLSLHKIMMQKVTLRVGVCEMCKNLS
jgi:hypothetical protein